MKEGIKFFPPQAFSEDEDSNSLKDQWYSRHLKAMQESSLWSSIENNRLHTYRFLWLRTFHQPVVIRLTINDIGEGQLILKITDGAGGYAPGHLIHNEIGFLPKESVDEFLAKLGSLAFWSLPTTVPYRGLDGAHWILEGLKDGVYHLVDRWSPGEGEYRETALKLVSFANLTVENIY